MASEASVAMVLVVVAAIVSSDLPAAHAGTNFISRTCRRTHDAALCVAVLNADPRSARADTLHGLADIALDLATETSLENGWFVNLLRSNNVRTPKGGATRVCRTAYVDAVKELVIDARDRFDDGDYAEASELVASAQRAGERCEDAFKEVSAISPVTDETRQMTERCVVARGLIDRLASSSCCCSCSQKSF